MNDRNRVYTRLNNISELIYLEAEKRAEAQPIFENSHRKDEANGVGCLGEVIAEHWMRRNGIHFISELNKTTHDYRVNSSLKIDVKAKDRTVGPRSFYDNSAPLYNHEHQRPDYFLFISLERDRNNNTKKIRRFHTAYIVGSISYEEIDQVGIRFLEDEEDWRNGTPFWTDCLNVAMWQLVPLSETIEIFKGQRDKPSINACINTELVKIMQYRIKEGLYEPRDLPDVPS